MRGSRIGRVEVSGELLRSVLHMPEGTRLVDAGFSFTSETVTLVVEHPDLPPMPEHTPTTPLLSPSIQHHPERYEWKWNLPDSDDTKEAS